MHCLSCSFGFLLSHYHVIHNIWRGSLALQSLARIMFRAYESSNNHLLGKKKNNIDTFGHFSSVRLNYLHANQLKQVQTKWRTASEWYQKKYQCWYVFFSSKLQKERISLFFSTTETCVHLILKPFFRHSTAVFAHLTISIELVFSLPKANSH